MKKSEQDFKKLYLENQVCFPLYAASRLTTKIYEPFLKKLDITYPQYLVLMVLWKENHQAIKQIGKLLFLETNTLTPLLKRMEKKELVVRKRSEKDERKVVISLTPKGENLKAEAVKIPDELLKSFDEKSTNKEFNSLHEIIGMLIENMSKNALLSVN